MLAGLVWLTGFGLAGARGISDRIARRALRRRAREAPDPTLRLLVRRCAQRLGVRRPVRLLVSGEISVPVTWGHLRPVVLVPLGFDRWSPARQRVVLLHEFAHVARWDAAARTLLDAVCALHWFNPLSWLTARRILLEAEIACDDRVLAHGVHHVDYAARLIETARSRPALPAPSLLGLPGTSELERRVRAMADPMRRRTRPAVLSALGTIAAALLVTTVVCGAVRPETHASVPDDVRLVLDAASSLRTDAELERALLRVLRAGLPASLHPPFLDEVRRLRSDAASQDVLTAFLDSRGLAEPDQLRILDRIERMSAVAARQDTLVALAETQSLTRGSRSRLREIASRLQRPSARAIVLAALSHSP